MKEIIKKIWNGSLKGVVMGLGAIVAGIMYFITFIAFVMEVFISFLIGGVMLVSYGFTEFIALITFNDVLKAKAEDLFASFIEWVIHTCKMKLDE